MTFTLNATPHVVTINYKNGSSSEHTVTGIQKAKELVMAFDMMDRADKNPPTSFMIVGVFNSKPTGFKSER